VFISSFIAVNYCRLPKTVSARIENDMHEDLADKCNKLGCRMNDFIKASVEFCLYGSVNFDFGDEENEGPQESSTPTHAPRVHYLEPPKADTQRPMASPGRIRLASDE